MTMSEPPTKESFSYAVPCVEFWESQRGLCKLAVQRKSLVKEAEGKAIVHPSLPNLRLNYLLLKGYTKTMKEKGVILTKHMTYILPAISDFYESMDPELDTKLDGPRTVIYGTAAVVKKMLTVIKRKWRKWELPRVAGTNDIIFCFIFTVLQAFK